MMRKKLTLHSCACLKALNRFSPSGLKGIPCCIQSLLSTLMFVLNRELLGYAIVFETKYLFIFYFITINRSTDWVRKSLLQPWCSKFANVKFRCMKIYVFYQGGAIQMMPFKSPVHYVHQLE